MSKRKRIDIKILRAHAREKGGVCKSDAYFKAMTKYTWQCEKGHEWDANWNKIQQGRWCPDCAIKRNADKQRGNITPCQEHAHRMGGECLSTDYKNANTHLRWRCGKGHEWDAVWNSIKKGTWCPECAGVKRLELSICQEHARSKGGMCLSFEYTNANTKLRWRCADGHEWDAVWGSIQQGSWCPDCAIQRNADKLRGDISTCQEHAHRMGGECLSTEYINSQIKLKWRCADGHEWDAIWNSVRKGSWCPDCGIQSAADKQRLDISICQERAHRMGGECLSTEYKNAHTKLKWRCADGHEWDATWGKIQQGRWCPECPYKSEQFSRDVLEYLCRPHLFTKVRPDWLCNPKTGNNLELDGYCEALDLAFEYNGIQHYEYHPHFHNDEEEFEYQQWRDAFKKERCAEHNVHLIVIPNKYSLYNRPELFDFIRDALIRLHVPFDRSKTLDDFVHAVPHQCLITDYFQS